MIGSFCPGGTIGTKHTLLLLLTLACSTTERETLLAMEQEISDLRRENQELKEKINRLSVGASAPAEAPLDDAATRLTRIQQAIDALQPEEARRLLTEARAAGIDADKAKRFDRAETALSIIGTSAPSLDVERWYQGYGSWYGARVTVVVFFEAWCSHCQEHVPRLQSEVFDRWRSRGVEVIGVTRASRSTTDEQVQSFLTERGITFPIGRDRGRTLTDAFGVTGVPAVALVRDQTIVWRGHPTRVTDELLEAALK